MSDGGKGSSPRPFSVSQDEWSKRWDAIFQRDLKDNAGDPVTRDNAKAEDEAFEQVNKIQ
jgi:hypothetical protein